MSNQTVFNSDNCTYATCSVAEYGELHYIPSLAGNAFYLAVFSLYLIGQCYLGIRYRIWGYLVGMVGGLALEIIGYVGRIMLHHNVFDQNLFIIYLVGLTIGPAFFSASIYLCLARIIAIYGADLSLLKPRTITCVFVLSDFISLVLQAAGGAITSTANDHNTHQMGINIMIAGLATQVASMTVFICCCLHYAWSVRQNVASVNPNSEGLRRSQKFKVFLFALGVATIAILIRCCFRVAELSKGFDGSLANNQVLFMILEGAMMVIAVTALTVGHPGLAIGTGLWQAGGFHFRSKKNLSVVLMHSTPDEIEEQKELPEPSTV